MAQAEFREYRRLLRGVNQFYQLLRCDCINGYAVGRKVSGGRILDQIAVQVFVNRKVSLRRLPLANRIPQVLRVPDDRAKGGVLEFVTDVQAARFSCLGYTERLRPAPSGVSVGHRDITAGTLGGLVRDLRTGRTVMLSNNHVLADSNAGAPGDPVLQPGPADGGADPGDRIATLARFVEIDFAEGAENRVDAAIAEPVDPADVAWDTLEVGPETPSAARHLGAEDLSLPVQKTGRTTGHTRGFVQSLFGTVRVKYDLFQKGTFVDQVIVSQPPGETAFSDGGDSGSLVYDDEGRCVGLLFAGSEGGEGEAATTIVNPIAAVLREMEVEFLSAGADSGGGGGGGASRRRKRRRGRRG